MVLLLLFEGPSFWLLLCALDLKTGLKQKWTMHKPQAKAGPSLYLKHCIKKSLTDQLT